MKKTVILSKDDINESIQRIAEEIVERNASLKDVVLVGIRTGGAFLAKRLQKALANAPAHDGAYFHMLPVKKDILK